MESKLANEGRRALILEAKHLSREERLRTFVRHSKLITELYNAGLRVRQAARSKG